MRSRKALFLPLAGASGLLAAVIPASAHAQVPLQGTVVAPQLSIDPDSLPHVESTRAPGGGNWNAGLMLQILERPLRLRDPGGMMRQGGIGHQFWTHAMFQIGIGTRVGLGLEVPILVHQYGDLSAVGATAPVVSFGDVRAVFRYTSRPQHGNPVAPPAGSSAAPAGAPSGPPANTPSAADNAFVGEGPGWGLNLSVTAPTGYARGLAGQGAFTFHPSFVGDFRLFGLILAGQIGYRFRFDQYWPVQGFRCEGSGAGTPNVSCITSVPLRDALTWAVGLRVPRGLLFNIASIYLEALGSIDMRSPAEPNTQYVELGGGFQRVFGELTATAHFSGGVTDVPGNPRFRAMIMLHWAPRFVDEDGDGLRDTPDQDQCVGLAEDRDGYQDNDGCPEDNDNDEVPDAEDRCPTVDEDADGFEDEDGCPDNDNDRDGVNDDADRCRDTAMGPSPDPERPGCPNDDTDDDGVANPDDRCPETRPGDHPDPARAGCPAPDGDSDGVPDASDRCPAEPAGTNARPEQQGCPEPDRDHDGVLNAQDRCADQAETLNGFQDDDGCADTAPAGTAPLRVRVVGASASNPGTIELLESLRWQRDDTLDRRQEALVAQFARAIVATTRINTRHYTLTVATTAPRVRGPNAVDAARAVRRRDHLLGLLRTAGVPEGAVRPVDPVPAPATPARVDRGVVLNVVETSAPATGSASAPASGSTSAPASGSASAPAAGTTSAPGSATPAPAPPPPASAAPRSAPTTNGATQGQ